MLIEFFEITLGLITISLLFFLVYSFLGGSRRVQARKTHRNKQQDQLKHIEQEFDDEYSGIDDELLSDNEYILKDEEDFSTDSLDEGLLGDFESKEPSFQTTPELSQPVVSESDLAISNLKEQAKEQIRISKVEPSYQAGAPTHRSDNGQIQLHEPSRILSIFILANGNKNFSGYELLQSLLSSGLRFGEMNIFHRHEETNGKGRILFSLASATEPGTFNIQNMGSFSGRGLCMFMKLLGTDRDNEAFDLFIKTAQKLADELNGSIYDDSRHPLTKDSLVHYQQIIRATKKEAQPFELAE